MLILLSPAKTLDFKTPSRGNTPTLPRLMPDSLQLLEILRDYEIPQLMKLQGISEKLALLNYERWQEMDWPFVPDQSKEALLTFKGDVYQALDAASLTQNQLDFAQGHLRLLSGFYGLLRPLDQIMPYRLEMSNPVINPRGKDLYDFWGSKITQMINEDAQNDNAIVNLASQEYFAAVKTAELQKPLINIHFKENQGGKLKIIGIHAKRARGLMTRFAIDNSIVNPDKLKSFDINGYSYQNELSTSQDWVFAR